MSDLRARCSSLGGQVKEGQHTVDVDNAHLAHVAIQGQHLSTHGAKAGEDGHSGSDWQWGAGQPQQSWRLADSKF